MKNILVILFYFIISNITYSKEVWVCNNNKDDCYKIEAVSYNNVKFIKYDYITDKMIMKYKHSIINLKISNLNLTNIKSNDIKKKNQALLERKKIVNILNKAKRIDLKRCIFSGYYSCKIFVNGKILKNIK